MLLPGLMGGAAYPNQRREFVRRRLYNERLILGTQPTHLRAMERLPSPRGAPARRPANDGRRLLLDANLSALRGVHAASTVCPRLFTSLTRTVVRSPRLRLEHH